MKKPYKNSKLYKILSRVWALPGVKNVPFALNLETLELTSTVKKKDLAVQMMNIMKHNQIGVWAVIFLHLHIGWILFSHYFLSNRSEGLWKLFPLGLFAIAAYIYIMFAVVLSSNLFGLLLNAWNSIVPKNLDGSGISSTNITTLLCVHQVGAVNEKAHSF